MKKFLKWWKVWGQVWGFLLLVFVTSFALTNDTFQSLAEENGWFGILWIVMFFGGTAWYGWQMKVHGWKLPEDIKRTH